MTKSSITFEAHYLNTCNIFFFSFVIWRCLRPHLRYSPCWCFTAILPCAERHNVICIIVYLLYHVTDPDTLLFYQKFYSFYYLYNANEVLQNKMLLLEGMVGWFWQLCQSAACYKSLNIIIITGLLSEFYLVVKVMHTFHCFPNSDTCGLGIHFYIPLCGLFNSLQGRFPRLVPYMYAALIIERVWSLATILTQYTDLCRATCGTSVQELIVQVADVSCSKKKYACQEKCVIPENIHAFPSGNSCWA